jgi:hypothetical protein
MQILYGEELLYPRRYIVEDCPYSVIHECLIDIPSSPPPYLEAFHFIKTVT